MSLPCLNKVQFSSVQFSSVQFSSVQFSSVQFSSVQFSSVQFSSVQFSSVQFSSVQFSSVQFSSGYFLDVPNFSAQLLRNCATRTSKMPYKFVKCVLIIFDLCCPQHVKMK